ncbi:MAG TPA: zinc ribbon domain-containing protein [bacterium]|nr:zinc ribbon domain-containing protein [bacterium]
MPVYEYECKSCGHRFEVLQSIKDEPIEDCPDCGGKVHKCLSAVGIMFKGSGFYCTDNKSSSSSISSAVPSGSSSGSGSKSSTDTD